MNSQQFVRYGNLALIGITHKDRLFDDSLDNIVNNLWLLFKNKNIFRPNRNNRGLDLSSDQALV